MRSLPQTLRLPARANSTRRKTSSVPFAFGSLQSRFRGKNGEFTEMLRMGILSF